VKSVLEGIGGCAALLVFLALLWSAVQAGWEKIWYGYSPSFAETAARARFEYTNPQTAIPNILWVVAAYLGGGAILYLVIAVFLWARKQWEPEAEQDEGPATVEEWKDLLDEATGHTHDGRPICQRCGEPIPEGKEILLTDDEKNALVQGRGVKSLPGAFRHMYGECAKPS